MSTTSRLLLTNNCATKKTIKEQTIEVPKSPLHQLIESGLKARSKALDTKIKSYREIIENFENGSDLEQLKKMKSKSDEAILEAYNTSFQENLWSDTAVKLTGNIAKLMGTGKGVSHSKRSNEREHERQIEGDIPFTIKETSSKSDMTKFYNNNDFCMVGVKVTDEGCQQLANLLADNYDINTPVQFYSIKGKDMNKVYDLYGDNAYPDKDFNILVVPTDTIKNCPNYAHIIADVKVLIHARYFNDVVDNNEYREYKAGRHKRSKQIEWLINALGESTTFYGEPFNGDTLYDNEDMLDFHPSQWLDLQLTTEFAEIYHTYLETIDDIVSNEATILTENYDNKVQRLQTMLEAEKRSFGDNIKMIIENLKKIFSTFFDKLKDKYGDNAKFINKYREVIEKKPFNFSNEMRSKGDILAGLRRITNTKLDFVKYDYEQMKEDLKDKRIFFEKHIKPHLNDTNSQRQLKWDNDTSIAEYCKAYFGAACSEDQYPMCTFKNKDFEANKPAIIKFLTESNTFLNGLRRDIDTLDVRARDVIRSDFNDTNVTTNTTNASVQNSINSAKQESYYSLLLDRVLYEADFKGDSQQTNPNEPTNAGNAKNKDQQDNTNNNENNQQQNDNQIPDQKKAFKTYLDAYRDVILAEITAVEFIVIELMQVIKAHAEIYIGKQTKENNKKKK